MHTDIEMIARQQIAERTARVYRDDTGRFTDDHPTRRRAARVLHRMAARMDPGEC